MATTGTSSPGRYAPNPTTTVSIRGGPIVTSPNIERKTPVPDQSSAETARLTRSAASAVSPAAGQNGPTAQQEKVKDVPAPVDYSGNKSKVVRPETKNPLNSYRTYNYLFTLAALKKEALDNPESYRNDDSQYFVIAKSAGKGTNISYDNVVDSSLVSSFKVESPGRFDFFINNVHIDTIMAFEEKTGVSTAIKLEFDLFEPYSMTGFIEALQTSAVSMGHDQYINCPYLLKMEFIGYPDSEEVSDTAEIVPNTTRYFVFTFTGLKIDVTEAGTRYHCKGVPFNERGHGEATKLKSPVKISGKTVKDLLTNLESALNDAMKEQAKSVSDETGSNHDTYTIEIPKVDEQTGIVNGSENDNITSKKIVELLKTDAHYSFPDNGEKDNSEKSRTPLNEITVSFSDGHSVQECITAIIRDSEYSRTLVKEFPNNIDDYGMVDYFTVQLEVTDLKIVNETTNRPFYNYKFLILPYKVHYTRIPLAQTGTVDPATKLLVANRAYDYLYTGANVDIKRFNLNFNTLFFQAIPKAMGNKVGSTSASKAVSSNEAVDASAPKQDTDAVKKTAIGSSPVAVPASSNNVNQGKTPNSGLPNTDPYAQLAKNLHQAILDNVDQVTAEIEIIGDPFYLVTAGVGNYKPEYKKFGETVDGEAAFTTGEVMILLTFRNPVDISETTGLATFSDKVTPYSGLFRVIKVQSTFNDGQFIQKLNLIRIASQIEDTRRPAADPTPAETKPNGYEAVCANPSATPASVNPPTTVASIAAQTNANILASINATSKMNTDPVLISAVPQTFSLPSKVSPLASLMK